MLLFSHFIVQRLQRTELHVSFLLMRLTQLEQSELTQCCIHMPTKPSTSSSQKWMG